VFGADGREDHVVCFVAYRRRRFVDVGINAADSEERWHVPWKLSTLKTDPDGKSASSKDFVMAAR